MLTTEWSDPDGDIARPERFYLVLAVGGAVAVLATAYAVLGARGAAIGVTAVALLAAAFLAHSSLSLVRDERAVEFAVDVRAADRIDQFLETLDEVVASRAAPVLVDPALGEPLAWYLRDADVTFAPPSEGAGALVRPAGLGFEGFTPLGEPWRLGEGWYPVDLKALPLWRWLVFREPYGNLDTLDAEILVPIP